MERILKVIFLIFGLFSTLANSQLARKRLIEKLMVGYNTEVRSVISAKTRTNVTVAITLLNFIQTVRVVLLIGKRITFRTKPKVGSNTPSILNVTGSTRI